MSIVRVKSLFISGVSCNWSSVIRTKKTEGQRLVKRNLTPEANPVSPAVVGRFLRKFFRTFADLLKRYKGEERSCRGGLPARECFRSPQPHILGPARARADTRLYTRDRKK
jgi:hypothetical protein